MAGHIFRFARREPDPSGKVVEASRARRPETGVEIARSLERAADERAPPSGTPVARPTTEKTGPQPRLALGEWLDSQGGRGPEDRSALLNASFLLLEETRSAIAAARDQLVRERRDAAGIQAGLEQRIEESNEQHALERTAWADERRGLSGALEESSQSVRELERDLARKSSQLEESGEALTRERDARTRAEQSAAELARTVDELRKASGVHATLEQRLQESSEQHALERDAWAEERSRLGSSLEEAGQSLRNLERDLARKSSQLEEATETLARERAARTRTDAAAGQLERTNEELREAIIAESGKKALLERRLEHERVIARTEQEALRNALAQANAQASAKAEEQRQQALELAQAREAMLGQAELMRSLLDARGGPDGPAEPPILDDAVNVAEADGGAATEASSARRAPDAPLHAPIEWIRAMLFLDGVESFHGFLDGEELTELVARLHRVRWIAGQHVPLVEPGSNTGDESSGIPVVQFLFGALPSYLFNAPGQWGDVFEDEPDADDGSDFGHAHRHLDKLLHYQHVIGRFIESGFAAGAIVTPSRLRPEDEGQGTDPWAGIADDPLTALAGIYAELELCCRESGPGAKAAWINEVVQASPWVYEDGARVDPVTQRKLLYLLTRTANSFQICLLELFGQIQTLQGDAAE